MGLGVQSRSRAVTAARLQNFYVEPRPQGEKVSIVAYGTPGLDLFTNLGDTPVRGMLTVEPDEKFFPVHRGTLYEVNNAAVVTSRGTLNTASGRVYQSHNGIVLLTVDGTDAYTFNTSTDSFAVVSSSLISNPKTTTWIDGYFVVASRAEFQISTDGTTWNALDVGVPESNPDGIVMVFADHGELLLFGDISLEFWVNTGATDFPFAPLKSSTVEWGCASAASVCKFNDGVAFLAQNRLGQVSVAVVRGHAVQVVSSPDVDFEINNYGNVGDATFFAYMLGGHPMLQCNFPSAEKSWLYDAFSNHWSPLKSFGSERQKNEIGIQFIGRTITSNFENGQLYEINPNSYTENGDMIEGEIISENVMSPDKERFTVDRFRLDMQTGVGLATGQGSNPQIMLQVSRDGGNGYGAEMWRDIGPIGRPLARVEWDRLGPGEQFNFKVRITDPVKRVITAAIVNPQD